MLSRSRTWPDYRFASVCVGGGVAGVGLAAGVNVCVSTGSRAISVFAEVGFGEDLPLPVDIHLDVTYSGILRLFNIRRILGMIGSGELDRLHGLLGQAEQQFAECAGTSG